MNPINSSPDPSEGDDTRAVLRILVHDYSGHPFQAQLARALAQRGHEILHVHCSSYQSGRGNLTHSASDLDNLRFEAIDLGANFARYSYVRRVRQEITYGRSFAKVAEHFAPDLIISSNDPLLSKALSAVWCSRNNVPWIHWLQDIYSSAMSSLVRSKLGVAGGPLARGFVATERGMLRRANAVVAITPDFLSTLQSWGIDDSKVVVIPNWAPLDEISVRPRNNAWARAHGLMGRYVFLYAGTLGLKHNPHLLVRLAEHFAEDASVAVVVASEGAGAEYLTEAARERQLGNLVLLPFQPFDALSDMLGASDVLVSLLEEDAGIFSVPSKVLTYHCAARPILAAMPLRNGASTLIKNASTGLVSGPSDEHTFLQNATTLRNDTDLSANFATNARSYAERTFNIDRIADEFVSIACSVTRGDAFSKTIDTL